MECRRNTAQSDRKSTINAFNDCEAHRQDWRLRALAAEARLAMADGYRIGDEYRIWFGADSDWYVGRVSDFCNLNVNGQWIRPGTGSIVRYGQPITGSEVFPTADAAFAALEASCGK